MKELTEEQCDLVSAYARALFKASIEAARQIAGPRSQAPNEVAVSVACTSLGHAYARAIAAAIGADASQSRREEALSFACADLRENVAYYVDCLALQGIPPGASVQ